MSVRDPRSESFVYSLNSRDVRMLSRHSHDISLREISNEIWNFPISDEKSRPLGRLFHLRAYNSTTDFFRLGF
jgi:hypothetical protein